MNIWNKKIQELVMSGNKENLILACSLIEDVSFIVAWRELSYRGLESHLNQYELPIVKEVFIGRFWTTIEPFHRVGVGDLITESTDYLSIIKEAYEQYIQSKNS